MIFYFSGTGNTRWAATMLANATGERLLFIPEELEGTCEYTLEADERIGFCFPVHGWQPPRIVRDFVDKLIMHTPSSIHLHYSYILCTCGDSTGLAVKMLADQLANKGIVIQSCQSLIMPESYVCLPFMYTDTPEREREKKEKAKIELEEYVKIVVNRQIGYSQLTLGLTPWTFSHIIGAYFNRFMITNRKFTVDTNACIHCGRCAKECPVNDITFDNIPTWKKDSSCTCCLSCYHHCPVHAINYGRITRKRGQYYYKP
jgi:NAD-dependent dihydropyrimidine dehydrogenase PreA subunit/flavodoxin